MHRSFLVWAGVEFSHCLYKFGIFGLLSVRLRVTEFQIETCCFTFVCGLAFFFSRFHAAPVLTR